MNVGDGHTDPVAAQGCNFNITEGGTTKEIATNAEEMANAASDAVKQLKATGSNDPIAAQNLINSKIEELGRPLTPEEIKEISNIPASEPAPASVEPGLIERLKVFLFGEETTKEGFRQPKKNRFLLIFILIVCLLLFGKF